MISLSFCKHKWGRVQEDGYQYCSNCGYATRPQPKDCEHSWECIESYVASRYDRYSDAHKDQGKVWVLRCRICGEMKNHVSSVTEVFNV